VNGQASAVAGTGFIGPAHVEALRRLGRPVAGILGSTSERGRAAAKRLNLPRSYDTFDELLADPSVGTVHLATPNKLHFAQCKAALMAGKHVICEKPLGMNSAETALLVRLAEESGRVAAVCYNTRFYPQNLNARSRIGGLGPLYHVTGSYLQDWLLFDTDFNWRVLEAEGGASRAVADIGTHWLDLVQFVVGRKVVALCADLMTVFPVRRRPAGQVETFQAAGGERVAVNIATEDAGSVLLRFEGQAKGCFSVSQVSAGRKNCLRWEAACATGALAWNSERPEELWLGRRDGESSLLLRSPEDAPGHSDYPAGHAEGFPDTFKQLFRAVYAHIDGTPSHYPTFADGHREALLVEAILASHRERRWVDVPPA
jgi:predicted dehydrogenase